MQGKKEFLETLDEESLEDEADEVSYDPFGLCSKDRGEDECMSEANSIFGESDFEPDCNSEEELVDIKKETKEFLDYSSRNEDMIGSSVEYDQELMSKDKQNDFMKEPIIKITPNADINTENCQTETTMKILTQLELQNEQAASIKNLMDKKEMLENISHSKFTVNDDTNSDLEEYMKEIEMYGRHGETESEEEAGIHYVPETNGQSNDDNHNNSIEKINSTQNKVPTFNVEYYEKEGIIIKSEVDYDKHDVDEISKEKSKQLQYDYVEKVSEKDLRNKDEYIGYSNKDEFREEEEAEKVGHDDEYNKINSSGYGKEDKNEEEDGTDDIEYRELKNALTNEGNSNHYVNEKEGTGTVDMDTTMPTGTNDITEEDGEIKMAPYKDVWRICDGQKYKFDSHVDNSKNTNVVQYAGGVGEIDVSNDEECSYEDEEDTDDKEYRKNLTEEKSIRLDDCKYEALMNNLTNEGSSHHYVNVKEEPGTEDMDTTLSTCTNDIAEEDEKGEIKIAPYKDVWRIYDGQKYNFDSYVDKSKYTDAVQYADKEGELDGRDIEDGEIDGSDDEDIGIYEDEDGTDNKEYIKSSTEEKSKSAELTNDLTNEGNNNHVANMKEETRTENMETTVPTYTNDVIEEDEDGKIKIVPYKDVWRIYDGQKYNYDSYVDQSKNTSEVKYDDEEGELDGSDIEEGEMDFSDEEKDNNYEDENKYYEEVKNDLSNEGNSTHYVNEKQESGTVDMDTTVPTSTNSITKEVGEIKIAPQMKDLDKGEEGELDESNEKISMEFSTDDDECKKGPTEGNGCRYENEKDKTEDMKNTVLIGIKDAEEEVDIVEINSYKDVWRKYDQQKYNFDSYIDKSKKIDAAQYEDENDGRNVARLPTKVPFDDDDFKSDSNFTQIPVLTCTDDYTSEVVTAKVDPYEEILQPKYASEVYADQSKDIKKSIFVEKDSNVYGLKTSNSSHGYQLAVGEEKQSRKRAGSHGIVARRRSIFEIEDQKSIAADPMDETIVILTNAEKREKETKKEGSANLSVESALRTRSTSHGKGYGKGLVANRRSFFE